MDGGQKHQDGAAVAGPAADGARRLPEWEGAIGRGSACLRATAKRYRVRARNPARAALEALRRHGLDGPGAREGGVWIAIHLLPDTRTARAVFAVGGGADTPALQLRAAELLPPGSPLLGPGSPFDAAAIEAELPRVARLGAQRMVGSSGLREVVRGAFWQREATLYSSTAMVLAAFGFPMSAEVFAVGGVLLLIQGALRLGVREGRIALAARTLLNDGSRRDALRAQAVRALFARMHGIAGPDGQPRRVVLREAAAVPDLRGEQRLSLLVDEDAAVTTGPAGGPPGFAAHANAEGNAAAPPNDNLLTVVFRRPRRQPAPAESAARTDTPQPSRDGAGLPAVMSRPAVEEEEIEVIEAELLDPDPDGFDVPPREWWA